jgi:chromosome segregation ATPase
VATSKSPASASLNELGKVFSQLSSNVSDLERDLKTKGEECDALVKALKESEEQQETQRASMVAELASLTSKMNAVKEEMASLQDGAETAKKSMKEKETLLAAAAEEIRKVKEENREVKEENSTVKEENRKVKEEKAALESRAVSAKRQLEAVIMGILGPTE